MSKQSFLRRNEPLIIVAAAAILVGGLFTFEIMTGLPASVRGTPIYNALPTTSAERARLRTLRPAAQTPALRAAARRAARSASSASSSRSSVR